MKSDGLDAIATAFDDFRAPNSSWARLDIWWFDVEVEQGRFDRDYCDEVFKAAADVSVSLSVVLAYAPPWATPGGHPFSSRKTSTTTYRS